MADKVKVKRADIYAAKTRLELDKQQGRKSETWVEKLAKTPLHEPGAKRPGPNPSEELKTTQGAAEAMRNLEKTYADLVDQGEYLVTKIRTMKSVDQAGELPKRSPRIRTRSGERLGVTRNASGAGKAGLRPVVGKVMFFDEEKNFSVIRAEGADADVYVYYGNAMKKAGDIIDKVVFDVTQGPKGPQAENVRPL